MFDPELIPQISPDEARSRGLLSATLLRRMHLEPTGDPVARVTEENGIERYYYHPQRVREATPANWYQKPAEKPVDPIRLENGKIIGRMGYKRAALMGYYTKEALKLKHYDANGDPVAYLKRYDGTIVYFYDKEIAIRQPRFCVRCRRNIRYRNKLCRDCYEKEMAVRRAEGDARRAEHYHASRSKTLFFDLELTGVYSYDEILSVSIMDGTGKMLMNTLVKPVRRKRWKETEKIHGITPEMVEDAPMLESLTPEIQKLFDDADAVIAYGIVTDYSHIKYIYPTEAQRQALRRKTRCAATEYSRYVQEHHPELTHLSLSDAMQTLGLSWEGTAHNSDADTIACAKVWEALFPNYYDD